MSLSEHRQVCLEKINETNHFFQLTHPYSSGRVSDQLVALHALFGCLDQVVTQSTDEHIARTKLNWWRLELRNEAIQQSRHPVVEHLIATGAAKLLAGDVLTQLLDATEQRLEAKSPTGIGELNQLCQDVYRPRITAELALESDVPAFGARQASMARKGGMILLLRETFNGKRSAEDRLWWVPLQSLARHGLNRAQLSQNLESASAAAVFREIYEAIGFSPETGNRMKVQKDTGASLPTRHLRLQESLHERQLKRIAKFGPASGRAGLNRFYLRDVFVLWMAARNEA